MKDPKPSTPFVAYAHRAQVLRIGDLEIGNGSTAWV